MSTKIFNGYSMPLCSLQELQKFSMDLRHKIQEEMLNLYYKKILENSTFEYDKITIASYPIQPSKGNILWKVQSKIQSKFYEIERTQIRNPSFDFSFDLSFLPIEDKILIMIFTEQDSYKQIFLSFPQTTAYPYFDNCDQPPSISDEEWKTREKEWNSALLPYDIPALQGFSVQCVNFLPSVFADDLETYKHHIPTLEERIHKIATIQLSMLFDARFQRHYNTYPKASDYIHWKDLPTTKLKLTSLKLKLQKQLKPKLTISDFIP